jgi:urease accessory protein UreH
MSGRAARGEAWRFASIDHELRLRVGGGLEYLERYCLSPRSRQSSRRWMAGTANYVGTMLVCSELATADRAEEAHSEVASIDGVRAAVDRLTDRLAVGRVASGQGPPFSAARVALRRRFCRPPLRRP